MSDLRVTLVQCDLRWEDPDANCRMLEETLGDLGQADTDLIVLPEMFATGFTMNSREMAEPMAESRSVAWLKEQAHRRGCVVTGSVAVVENGDYFNRLVWARPDGSLATYDKRHLFRMAGEHERYAMGHERVIVELKGFRLLLSVCYDLRFPVWLRQQPAPDEHFEYDAALRRQLAGPAPPPLAHPAAGTGHREPLPGDRRESRRRGRQRAALRWRLHADRRQGRGADRRA